MLHLLLTIHSSLQDLGDIRQLVVCCLDLWPWLNSEFDLNEDLEDESDMDQDLEDDFEIVLFKKLKKALQEVLKEIEVWAQQYENDGLYKDAVYLHGRMHSDVKEESRIVPTLPAVYEKIGDYPAAELAQEQLMGIILAKRRGNNDEEQIREVETLSRLLNLFHTRLQVLGSASPTYAKLSIVYRAAALDLELLNATLLNQGLIVLDCLEYVTTSSLHIAVAKSAPNLARILLQKGANPNLEDFSGATPLHIAVKDRTKAMVQKSLHWDPANKRKDIRSSTHIQIASSRGKNESILSSLIEKGADIEANDHKGRTPLRMAIETDSPLSAQFLIRHGADVNATWIQEPLLCGAVREEKEWAVDLLLENGANLQAFDGKGRQALSYAVENGHESMFKVLLERGGVNDATFDPMLQTTWLHLAVSGGNLSIIEMILKAGVDTNKTDTWGDPPLHYLIKFGSRFGSIHLGKICNLLLEFGAQVNIRNQHFHTPLHSAVSIGRSEVVNLLLTAGADSKCMNLQGETTMDMARRFSSWHSLDPLRKAILEMLSYQSRTTSFT